MIFMALGCLLLGIFCGRFVFTPEINAMMDAVASWALVILLASVGIQIGSNRGIFRKIAAYHVRILLVPLGVVVGSLAGGLLSGLILGVPVGEAGALSCGFGFYSLSALLLKELGGAQMGTAAFLTNMLRELFSFLLIPLVARYCGRYAAVAPSGATAMDTTLPVIARATDGETALIAAVSGAVLTGLAPVLIPLFYQL